MSQVSRDGGERRRIVFGLVRLLLVAAVLLGRLFGCGWTFPGRPLDPLTVRRRQIAVNHPPQPSFIVPVCHRIPPVQPVERSREPPLSRSRLRSQESQGFRCPSHQCGNGAASADTEFRKNPGNRVRAPPPPPQETGRGTSGPPHTGNTTPDAKGDAHEPGNPNPEDPDRPPSSWLARLLSWPAPPSPSTSRRRIPNSSGPGSSGTSSPTWKPSARLTATPLPRCRRSSTP